MAKPWRLALSLDTLRKQLNALFPNRSKASDGTIGDTAHSNRTSDHNPNSAGVVTAMDLTHDPAHGVVGQKLAEALIKDRRVKYVIFSGKIWKARTRVWEVYRGSNAHNHHVHVSVQGDSSLADSVTAWELL
jgi:hypothetical protein